MTDVERVISMVRQHERLSRREIIVLLGTTEFRASRAIVAAHLDGMIDRTVEPRSGAHVYTPADTERTRP